MSISPNIGTSPNSVQGQFINVEDAATSRPTIHHQWGVTAAAQDWGVSCSGCQQPLQYQPVSVGYRLNQHTRCSNGCRKDDLSKTVLIRRQTAPLIGDTSQILGTEWWHASMYEPNVFEQDSIEHVGSRDAALHRMIGDQHLYNFDRYLYRITLRHDATVDPLTWVETPFTPVEFGFRYVPSEYDIRPYINAMEAPGELSLKLCGSAIESYTYVGKLTVDRGTRGNQGVASADFAL